MHVTYTLSKIATLTNNKFFAIKLNMLQDNSKSIVIVYRPKIAIAKW